MVLESNGRPIVRYICATVVAKTFLCVFLGVHNNMNNIHSIAFITRGYPSLRDPTWNTFIRQFAHAVARQGVACTIVQPVPFHRMWGRNALPYRSVEFLDSGHHVVVLRPRFLSFSVRAWFARLGPLNPAAWTLRAFTTAALDVLKNENVRPDAVYGHFLYLGGAAAVRIGCTLGIPSFPRVGEGEVKTTNGFGKVRVRKDLIQATAFIANSAPLERMLMKQIGIASAKIGVFPNGIDLLRFKPRDKDTARKHFGLPSEMFVVAFVGRYAHEKGAVRVSLAIDGLEGVGGIFAGAGPCPPNGKNVLFNQPVPHPDIPEFLSCADVFVLPTIIEGCSNAIVEAMACGLPIISSEGEFNDLLLAESMSFRVDPMNVTQIREAIRRIRDDVDLRRRMSEAALVRAKNFNIDSLAQRILSFMAEKAVMKDPLGTDKSQAE